MKLLQRRRARSKWKGYEVVCEEFLRRVRLVYRLVEVNEGRYIRGHDAEVQDSLYGLYSKHMRHAERIDAYDLEEHMRFSFPHLRTAAERYDEEIRSKYAGILLGGVLKDTTTLECAICGWTATMWASPSTRFRQLRAHQQSSAAERPCSKSPVAVFIARLSKKDRAILRAAYGDFSLRFLLSDNDGMWQTDLERAREADARKVPA